MTPRSIAITCENEEATTQLAVHIAQHIAPGDVILLDGPVGAGKTHFARALIKSLLVTDEDVPSPTFTLVQTYDTTKGALWHADLYRLSSDYEVEELGLDDAMDSAICLIEWPDRLGPLAPSHAVLMSLAPMDNARHITASWSDPKWARVFEGVTYD